MSLGLRIASGAVLPDIILAGIGVIWLMIWPGIGVVWYLTILETIGVTANFLILRHQLFGSQPHKSLVAHLCMRGFIVAALWMAVRKSKTAKPAIS